ncbi:MAG: hypothetical protein LWX01_11555 [Deltaproteobacteria bacterium]|nr:hypothetical protein [Deltaproteobacteria bacterium]
MRIDEILIEERKTDGRIDFHDHISRVRKEASSWLKGIEKNGIEHSKRLEDYLDRLIPDEFKEKLKPAEVFILLYAVYLHDIGYRCSAPIFLKAQYRRHPDASRCSINTTRGHQ